MESAKTYQYLGLGHLAITVNDMAATAAFYGGLLEMPLVATLDLPFGGQHFLYDIGNGDVLAFLWDPDEYAKPAAPGVATPTFTGDSTAAGSMNHLAIEISPDDVHRYWERLSSKDIDFTFIAHSWDRPPNLEGETLDDIDDGCFCASLYFVDPDGIQLELCAMLPAWERRTSEAEPRRRTPPVRDAPTLAVSPS